MKEDYCYEKNIRKQTGVENTGRKTRTLRRKNARIC
jgi:hypothetical protein